MTILYANFCAITPLFISIHFYALSHSVAVRLAGGTSEAEGRVEVYINGEWGTVCSLGWDPLDGKVVCRQLGYKGVKRTYSDLSQVNFGEGTGHSWLADLRCTGSEANLLQCPHSDAANVCTHTVDSGVVCTNEDLPDEGELVHLCMCMYACLQDHGCSGSEYSNLTSIIYYTHCTLCKGMMTYNLLRYVSYVIMQLHVLYCINSISQH